MNRTGRDVANVVREYISRNPFDGIGIDVIEDEVARSGAEWRVPVHPTEEPLERSPFYEYLADIAGEIEDNEEEYVFLVPSDPIDSSLRRAIEKDGSTAGMRQAAIRATGQWDDKLNQVYQELLSVVEHDARLSLEESQRTWSAFRDAECKAIQAVIGCKEGTMWRVMASGMMMDLVKDRVHQLQDYLWKLKQ